MSSRHVTKRERKYAARKQTPSHGRTKTHRSHKAYTRVQKARLLKRELIDV